MTLRQVLDRGSPMHASLGDELGVDSGPLLVRVLVADSRPPTRIGIWLALENAGCEVCAEAADARHAVELAELERPDVCLIEAGLPGDALLATAEIVLLVPDTRVVLFGGSADESCLFAALEAGAVGFLPDDTDSHALAHALRATIRGEAALPRRLVAKLICEFRERHRRGSLPFLRDLTSRELEVLVLLHKGMSTAEISRQLFVAPVTVRTHVASILRKLHVSDRQAAAHLLDPL